MLDQPTIVPKPQPRPVAITKMFGILLISTIGDEARVDRTRSTSLWQAREE